MLTSNSSNSGSPEGSWRSSASTPRSKTKAAEIEPDPDTSKRRSAKDQTYRSPRVIQRCSSHVPVPEMKRSNRVTELECHIAQLQEDIKRTRYHLSLSESLKRQAQNEAEEAKKRHAVLSAKYEDSQRQLEELAASEEARTRELCVISKKMDRAWQAELEATQNHRSVDMGALSAAKNEIQRLTKQLEVAATESEAARGKQSGKVCSELRAAKQEMAETLSTIEDLKVRIRAGEENRAERESAVDRTRHQLETAKGALEALRSEELKLNESLTSVASELQKSRSQEGLLEMAVEKFQADRYGVESELERLSSELERSVMSHMEEQVKNTVEIRSAYELADRLRHESGLREAGLGSALEDTKSEIVELKEKLQAVSDTKERLEMESKVAADVARLKAEVRNKDARLQAMTEENKLLKLEIARHRMVMGEVESSRAREREAVMKLAVVSTEAESSGRRAARVSEQLDAARAVKVETEAELRRVRVQSAQWRKAAEMATDILADDDSYGESQKKWSKNMLLKKIGGMLKKDQTQT
ncbi:interactor of constitutive active ROPs 2, chloroplastic-like isoform X3 [Iris pallida]|uniref:Interactor of constitutive active ROPs 2, chloroplastic-like isoform X3 n=1 Tax=Iris pallida TaxID=29817 RepID=A0AAX6F8B5_IRIPA|nr:interactor of constitutive active ROPs 2, chloroplastic-like isoform X3 [Iris pallida]